MVIGVSSNVGGTNGQTPTARATGAMITNPNSDPVATSFAGPLAGVTTGLNFDGQSAQDNRDVFGFAFVPSDTNGAVGATQFVQMVNVTIAVYDKSSAAHCNSGPRQSIRFGLALAVSASSVEARPRFPMAVILSSSTTTWPDAGWSASCSTTAHSPTPRSA
jgi:hypothetical protein